MLALVFIVLASLIGLLIVEKFFKQANPFFTLISSFVFGSIFSIWLVYLLVIFTSGNILMGIGIYAAIAVILFFIFKEQLRNKINFLIKNISKKDAIAIIILLASSFLIFNMSFGYDVKTSQFLIASNLYQDMGAHIPFIRSFSIGNNYPSEVPFFAGEKLTYHFMFDLYVGILEKLGLRIDIAYNLLSSISLTSLILAIYQFTKQIFSSKLVAIISVILFLFNSDLSFITFIKQYGFSLSSIWHNSSYELASLFPIIYSPFLHLNVLLNQRHLIFSLALILTITYLIVENKVEGRRSLIALGLLIGLSPFWNMFAFISSVIILIMSGLLGVMKMKKAFIVLISALAVSLPQLILLLSNSHSSIAFKPGFLISNTFSLQGFLLFWIWSLGISAILIIAGFLISNKKQRIVFAIFLPLFILPNLFRFAPNIFDNHKFFNIWILIANGFASYALVKLFEKNVFSKILSLIILFFITFSGILNFLVAKNDVQTKIIDYKNNSFMTWVSNNLSKKAIILTNGDIYDPISLIGNKVFLTRPYYVFLYGGDISKRLDERKTILNGLSDKNIREILRLEDIEYVIIYERGFAPNLLPVNNDYFLKNFQKVYEDNYAIVYKI
jgi:hypothetical protein